MEDYEDEGSPHPLTRILKYVAMTGVAALVFASGMASGMLVDGTSETLLAYRQQIESKSAPKSRKVPVVVTYSQPAPQPVADMMQAAWFPENNTVRWDVSLAPGQSMSGLSVRNTHTDRNLVIVLNAIGSTGEWIRAGVVNVAAGREAVVHPPTGSYSMTVLSMPVTMPYSELERASTSRTVYFDLLDPETADTQPVTRFQIADGEPQRLPDLTTYALQDRGDNGDDA